MKQINYSFWLEMVKYRKVPETNVFDKFMVRVFTKVL